LLKNVKDKPKPLLNKKNKLKENLQLLFLLK